MSRTTTTRAAVAAVLAAVLAAATLVALPTVNAAGADDRAERWAGYRIPQTGRAAGGWIGGYRVGRTPVFVITPERRPNRAGFRAVNPTTDLQGRRGPTRRETQRAAWILSKYGGYKDAEQAAAVDAAVVHLLGDRAWRLGGSRGAARVRATGDPATVRRFVRLMLRASRASAGRYGATVMASTADVGGVTSVTVRVIDGHGGPVAGLPVTVTSPDGGASQPDAGPVDAVTGDDGRAVVRLAAPLAGWRTVVAHVRQVPEHRLRVRGADRSGQAAAAEGGVRRTVVASARVPVRGPQTLSIAADPGQLVVGSPARVVATVGGDGVDRTAIATLHGPFSSDGAAHCGTASAAEVSAKVTADGAYAMPAVAPSGGGYFAWRVAVSGTDTSTPVATCGAVVKVRARPVTSLDWAPAVPSANSNVTATATVSGIAFPAPVTVRITLYQDGNCGSSIDFDELTRYGNGAISSVFFVAVSGTYSWRAETQAVPGDLWVGTASPCLPMTVS